MQHLLRGEGGVYYEDLYPLISFLPRFSTKPELASEDDMLPLWRASDMDHKLHQTIRQETMSTLSSAPPSRANTAPLPNMMGDEFSEKEIKDSESWAANSMGGRKKHHKRRFRPEQVLPVLPSERELKPARSPPVSSVYDYFGFLRLLKPLIRPLSKSLHKQTPSDLPTSARGRTFTGKRVKPEAADSNVAMEITLFLSTYYSWLMRQTLLTPASATAMNNAIASLQDAVTNLERIKNTPLPFAYQAHLRMSLWYVTPSSPSMRALTDVFAFDLCPQALSVLPAGTCFCCIVVITLINQPVPTFQFQIYSAFKWLTIP